MAGDYQSAQYILDTLSFIFDRWEFLLSLLITIIAGGSYFTYKVVTKKKNTVSIAQKGEENQASTMVDSPDASPQTAGGDAVRQDGDGGVRAAITNSPGSTINSYYTAATPDEALRQNPLGDHRQSPPLDVNQSHILTEVQKIIENTNIPNSFADRYQIAIAHLNNNSAQVCASAYHSAFLNVVPVFLDRSTYGDEAPSGENLDALRTSFEEIRAFLNSASHDSVALRASVRGFEDALMILLGYL